MDVESVQLFTALLSFLAIAGAVLLVLARLLASRWPLARDLGSAVSEAGLWLGFLVAAVATLGSLYFSESANYVPCTMCWYQRIAMYPLAPILLIAAIRRDRLVAWYATPLASVGAGIALYHYLIEWNPSLEGGACSATGPSCADIWFREFGFVTLPFMALAGFVAILAFLLVSFGDTDDQLAADADDPSTESTPA